MTGALPATMDTRVLVSWDGTGTFDGAYDNVTADVHAEPGVTISLGRDGARTLNPPRVVACDFAVVNLDGTYSQERASSPIYQVVLPGRPVTVVSYHGTADAYDGDDAYDVDDYYDSVALYSLARATIDDISQSVGYGQEAVSFSTLGVESLLVNSTVTVGLMTNPRVDECITAILDAASWPAAARDIAVSDTQLAYFWCDDRAPWEAIQQLVRSEGPGAIWVDGSGVFHFENRNYRVTQTRSTQSQAAFTDLAGGLPSDYDEYDDYDTSDYYDGPTAAYFVDLSYGPGFRDIYNRATYTVNHRTVAALGVVWTYGATLTLGAGESVTLIARPNDPFTAAVTPASGTDFTVSGGTVSVVLSASSGLVAFITITTLSGAPVVTGLQLRAQALTVVGTTTYQNTIDASASIARFSPVPGQNIPIVLNVDGWPEISRGQAQGVCDAWVVRYMVQRPAVTITLRNADGGHLSEILRRQVSDRITIRERSTGLNADVWINSKQLTIAGANGVVIAADFACEKCDEVSGFVWDGAATLWDTARWGF